ncbi:MAG: cell division topological specificity factor MinE [Firmicutes bacterium HGW-Firmicutes-15]|nr:MAG: cell division topological specificity factor MinE [Firmicutes bacterium HGW-Firmicutes-15]
MLDIIARFFGKDSTGSKDVARERLRLVLIHDRSLVSPELINALKEDLIQVIQQYMDIDVESLLVNLENEDDSVALVANIPIKGLKRAVNI